ncbi:MAG: carboxypeptidase-like regulatory domain-containing protein [Filimonas sp.]|nr:carboxypeptidase-like regulatory domain-containing protein [Filimonas sp.]
MKIITAFCFLFFSGQAIFAQLINIHGRVIDADSKRNLPGVTIITGESINISDSTGYFHLNVQSSALKRNGLIFSCIGYVQKKVSFDTSNSYNIELKATYFELPEIKVMGSGLSIIKKAINSVSQNYPDKSYLSTGFMRLQYLRNKSDYFNSDAIVQVYTPSITSSKKSVVKVVQNHIDTITDKSLVFIKWIGGYLSPIHADFVKNKEPYINLKKMKNFRYQLMGKQLYYNRTTYMINFSQHDSTRKETAMGGTLYIDSATYAFAGADISYFNITRYGTLPKSKLQYHIRYSLLNNKWYLQETFMKGNTIYKKENPTTLVDYTTTKTDTGTVKPFSYSEIIQEDDVTQLINKPGAASELTGMDSALQNTVHGEEVTGLPAIDTIRLNNATRQRKKSNWLNYFTQDNFRYSLSIMRFPLQLNTPDQKKSDFVNYGFQIGTYFRIYKNLFLQFEGSGNTGAQKTVLSLYAFHLAYDINLKTTGHTITVSPFAGYDILSINQKEAQLKSSANYFIYGLKGALEISHHVFLFASVGRNIITLKGESGFLPVAYTPSLGVLIKR